MYRESKGQRGVYKVFQMRLPREQVYKAKRSVQGHHIATGVAVLLLFFQLSRSFLVAPINDAICLHGISSPELASDHHDHAVASAHRDSDSKGNSFQHCKDTDAGAAVTSGQPFGIFTAPALPLPQGTWIVRTGTPSAAIQNFLPPPFQPPRA
jgi:hypothetical protein